MTIEECFKEFTNVNIHEFQDIDDFYTLLKKDFSDIPLPAKDSLRLDDFFFLLFLNKIEPQFKNIPALILNEYPHYLSALSTIKENEPLVCERFELFLDGVEIANCYNELVDLKTQEERSARDLQLKEGLYQYKLPQPRILLDSLEQGLPQCSGIALGVERLFHWASGSKDFFLHDFT
jgi:lysyl-tRNA synthetase class 2